MTQARTPTCFRGLPPATAPARQTRIYAKNNTQFVGISNTNTYIWFPAGDHINIYSDAALIGFGNQAHATSLIYVNSSIDRLVINEINRYTMTNGYNICKTGITTGVSCGNVFWSYPTTLTGTLFVDTSTGQTGCCANVYDLICADMYADGGDSGSPVYKPTPNSTVTAGAGGLLGYITGYHEGCFSPISDVEGYTGTHIALNAGS